jgi:hypothetical protein
MAPDTKLKVLLSFDEAHSLTSTLDGTASDKVLLNYLAEALNELCPRCFLRFSYPRNTASNTSPLRTQRLVLLESASRYLT